MNKSSRRSYAERIYGAKNLSSGAQIKNAAKQSIYYLWPVLESCHYLDAHMGSDRQGEN